jgi:Ca2+-binding RTX toxin-like protein
MQSTQSHPFTSVQTPLNHGSSDNDILLASDDSQQLRGGSGNDRLHGGNGNDELYGGSGDDILDGGPGDDQLHGGSDNDSLQGGLGHNTLQGGSGNDLFIVRATDQGSYNIITDFHFGQDTLVFSGFFNADTSEQTLLNHLTLTQRPLQLLLSLNDDDHQPLQRIELHHFGTFSDSGLSSEQILQNMLEQDSLRFS